MGCLTGVPAAANPEPLEAIAAIQSEGQFGPDHWRLSQARRIYYRIVRPLMPASLRPLLRTLSLPGQKRGSSLRWPIEDRFVRFQFETVRRLLERKRLETVPHIHFWPAGKRFALVLTHDVESLQGQQFVRQVAALEERYGFRSSFNFVPEGYQVDGDLLAELEERGFEVGVHGLKHDGKLFLSRDAFLKRAGRINHYLKTWGAVGFRAPLTHRNPEWMQALEIEYDSSFFDTDPYETIAGGTMSIWPFMLGRFVELPYTLPQDHTLMVTLGKDTPRLWLDKADFIRRYCGMALLNTHPDYMRTPKQFAIYRAFLGEMHQQTGFWHALPREVAAWWRARAAFSTGGGERVPDGRFCPTVGQIRRADKRSQSLSDGSGIILETG